MSIQSPPVTGFPDWSEQSLYDGPVLCNRDLQSPGIFTELYFGSVTSWWGICSQLNVRSNGTSQSTNRGLIQFIWFGDEAKTEELAQLWLYTYQNYVTWNGLVIPNYGPYVSIGVQGDPADNPIFEILCIATNRVQATSALPLVEPVLQLTDVVAAGQTNLYLPNSQVTGPAIISTVSDQALTWTFGVAAGNALNQFPLPPLVANAYQTFAWNLPLSQWQINYTNAGGADANIALSVTAQP